MSPRIFLPSGTGSSWYYVGNDNNLHTISIILSIGISIENMFIRFRAKLRHYALIITKFNHTCMVYIADHALKHCTLGISMHADVLTRAHFVFLLEFVLYILYTFYAPISVSLIDRSLLRLTNRTSSCYKLQIIDIVPFCTIVLYTFTILQYGISIFIASSLLII